MSNVPNQANFGNGKEKDMLEELVNGIGRGFDQNPETRALIERYGGTIDKQPIHQNEHSVELGEKIPDEDQLLKEKLGKPKGEKMSKRAARRMRREEEAEVAEKKDTKKEKISPEKPLSVEIPFEEGQELKVVNTSGQKESGWKFASVKGDRANITKTEKGKSFLRSVHIEDLVSWNSSKKQEAPKKQKEVTKEKPVVVQKESLPKPEEWMIGHTFKSEGNIVETKHYQKGALQLEKSQNPKKQEKEEKLEPKLEKPAFKIVDEKLASMGIKIDDLKSIEGFNNIAGSEGKIISVLKNLDQERFRKVAAEAREDAEKHIREGSGLMQKIWRRIRRNVDIQKRKEEYSKKDIDVQEYKKEIEGLIHLADVGPEISTNLVAEYLKENDVFDKNKVSRFNEIATAYAKLPPKHEWSKHSNKKKEFEKLESEYNKSREALFEGVASKEAMKLVNDAEFGIKMHQTLINHPDAELKLKNLAETKGWRRHWEAAKAQLGPGAFGFATAAGLRLGAKSAIVSVAGAVAIPLTAVALGAGFGYWRGGKKAAERLNKEEELMRMGFEDQTGSKRKIGSLLAKKAEIIQKLSRVTAAKEKISLEGDLENVENKILKLKNKSTDTNFVKSENMVSKIDHIKDMLAMTYGDYLNSNIKHKKTLEEFNEDKKSWAEQLEVRLEFVKRKLDEGKISFGNDKVAISNKYDLIKKMGEAKAEISLVADYNEKEISNQFGHTRRGLLEKILLNAEIRIKENRNIYKRNQAAIGAFTGALFADAGYQVGHIVSESFGSHVAHTIHSEAQALKASGKVLAGQQLERVVEDSVKATVSHQYSESLIKPTIDVNPIVNRPSAEEMNKAVLEEASRISRHESAEYAKSIITKQVEPISNHDSGMPKIKLDINTRASNITADLPNKPDTSQLYETRGVPAIKNLAPEKVVPEKPFEYVLKNETQSRELALKRYFSQTMSPEEAGKKAHLAMKEIFGPKGESGLPYVHQGDHVLISEKDGKLNLEVIPKGKVLENVLAKEISESVSIHDNQIDEFTGKEIKVDSAERAVTRTLRLNAEEYGFTGDSSDKIEVKEWADAMTKNVVQDNPGIRSVITNDGDKLNLTRTPTGGWFAEVKRATGETVSAPENIKAVEDVKEIVSFSNYEVQTPTSLPSVLDRVLATDPRFASLNDAGKDKALYDLFVNHFMKKGQTIEGFYQSLGISSGNPFDIKPGTLNLETGSSKIANTLTEVFKDVRNNKVSGNVIGFRKYLSKIVQSMKNIEPDELNEILIIEKLKELKK